ncbi:MAG: NAD(+) kinase, partial [Crenarchaeota archaeon]|nr:NAD(+) kinase [Thermoproteota archaeon]
MSKVIGIVSRTDKEEALKLAEEVIRRLESKGSTLLLEPKLAAYIHRDDCARPLEDMRA